MQKIQYQTFELAAYPMIYNFWRSMPEIVLTQADSPENMKLFLARNPGFSFLGFAEDKMVGTILSGHDGRRGFIYHLAVAPDFRGRGIGTQLVQLALNKLNQAGMEKVHLFVLQENLAGQRFWERMGFKGRSDIAVYSR